MKKIAPIVLERSGGLCEVCGSSEMVQLHHIIKGNGKRKQHQSVESVIALCWFHHHSTEGIHGRDGSMLDLQLKIQLQDTYFEQAHSEDEVRVMMGGKLY